MKQGSRLCAAGLCFALALSAAACGGGGETEQPDRSAPAFGQADATLTLSGIDESESGKISDELFGVFLEDINYASQSLDDNMIVNGSFETVGGAKLGSNYGWTAKGAQLTVSTDNSPLDGLYEYNGTNRVASHALVQTQPGGTLTNSGYAPVPMSVTEGLDYRFSAFLRSDADVEVTVEVVSGSNEYASVTFPVQAGGWKKYERTLHAEGTASEGVELRLTFSAAAAVSLDGVSFETTDSTVGIKNYLYDAVKELSPKFVRFPGGCITEGENYEQAYDWKNSVGAVQNGPDAGDDTVPAFTYTLNTEAGEKQVTTYGEYITRRPNINLWENNGSQFYLMDYGIGFYEYFLLCESLGASALPVVNCGLSCQGQAYPGAPLAGRHGKQVEDYIRDAADLIEFAKGGTDTKWGAIRALMGHEAPFEMHYLGVGNEQWNAGGNSDYFRGYYEKFLEDEDFMAACEQYGITLIVGNHQQLVHCEGSIDFNTGTPRTTGIAKEAAAAYMQSGKIGSLGQYGVQDHHYYNSPIDFLLHAHMYDGYTREGANRYEVFVGEYSANNTFREAGDYSGLYQVNGWLSALSEAAMMTGFERNGDIVKLAAYAPMFAPVSPSLRHWAVDMMLFTNTSLVRTANYYVQQLFMQNMGTRKLLSSLAYSDEDFATCSLGEGNASKIERLFYSASVDGEGNYVLKIVNAGEEKVKLNVDLGSFGSKIADVVSLFGELDDVNSLSSEPICPLEYTVGAFGGSVAGIELPYQSVTAIRFRAA